MAQADRAKAALSKLTWVLSLTRLGLFSERLIRAFWPLWSIAFVAAAALMMGLQDSLSIEIVWGLSVLTLVSLLAFAWRGLRQIRLPSREEALVRLDDTLPGRPVQTLLDAPAMGGADPATQAIWQAHQARMAEKVSQARPPRPDWAVSHLDPFGLRFTAVLLFSIALLFGSVGRMASLTAMAPGSGAPSLAQASWEGWITPPAYTGLPTLYLNDLPAGAIRIPENSQVSLRLYGEVGALTVGETVSARTQVPSAAEPEQAFLLKQDGSLDIFGENGRSWQISLIPDHAPRVTSVGPADISERGEMSLPFAAVDDYEVVEGTAQIALQLDQVRRDHGLAVAPEDLGVIDLPLPLPIAGTRQDFSETLIDDFSAHPWAHMPVQASLQVRDAAGQISDVYQLTFNLPARRFFDPLANALVEMRRDLLWSRENGPRIAKILRAISHRPDEGIFRKDSHYLRLRTILRHLERVLPAGIPDDDRDAIAAELWAFALELEEGNLDDARERMERAQERLAEAMKNGASPDEIARLMQELREATQDYMRQLAQQQNRNGAPDQGQQQAQNSMQMTQNDLQRMMDRIQELMEQGRMAEAQRALEEFQRLMENMQVAQGGQGQSSPGQQALDELGETLREQQGLSDQAFRDLQEQFNPNAQAGQNSENEGFSGGEGRGQAHDGTGGAGSGEGENGTPQDGQGLEGSLADRQQALRQELERQQNNLPGQGTAEGDAARDALGRAGDAMDGAEEALRNQDLAEAIDRQSEAMEALREGMRSLGEAMAQNQQNSGQDGQAQNNQGGARDPLGRSPGQQGMPGTEQGLLQGEDVYRRARDLLDEIRRRAGESDRPDLERDYLKRLLDRF